MVALGVKVLHVLGDQVAQVVLSEWRDPIEAPFLDGAHPALGEGVQVGT